MTLKVKERREEHEEGKTRSSACSEEKSVEANRKALGVLCAAASRHHFDNYFKYVPMYGVQIAFRDYNPVGGFFGSPWVGLKWFERFFNNYNSIRMIKNTVLLSLYSILWTFPIPIILALLINQVKWKKFQRVSQTILYAPHFISTMILCGMLRIFLSPYGGLISTIIQAFGGKATNLIDSATAFRTIYISSSVWQDAGWGTIIYIATLSSVDASLHEAARVDGANRLQVLGFITIPCIKDTIATNIMLNTLSTLGVYGLIYAMTGGGPANKTTTLPIYMYNQGLKKVCSLDSVPRLVC